MHAEPAVHLLKTQFSAAGIILFPVPVDAGLAETSAPLIERMMSLILSPKAKRESHKLARGCNCDVPAAARSLDRHIRYEAAWKPKY